MIMALFRLRNAAAAALFTATLASPALHAAEVWTQITVGSGSTSLSGTLGSIGVTMTSTVSTVAAAPSVNPPYNLYDIWDNDATVDIGGGNILYPNGARLYPASAKGNMQFVTAARTTANPITLTFSQPVFNPRVLVYSLDNSFVDFSATTTADGQPANISAATNSSAYFNSATKVLEREAYAVNFPYEGCSQPLPPSDPSGRGCGVMQFYGYYTQLKLNPQATRSTDGVGFQVGYDPDIAAAAARSIPTLTHGGLAALGLLLATLAARSLRRRPLQG